LSSARRASVSNSWFSPQRSGGVNQEFTAQLPRSPRSEAERRTLGITGLKKRQLFQIRVHPIVMWSSDSDSLMGY
jgi:hypothetical protein